LGKKLCTGFLEMPPYKKRVLIQNRHSYFHGLTLGFRWLTTYVNPSFFLKRNIFFIHGNPVSLHFQPPSIQIYEKPIFYHYFQNTGLRALRPHIFFDNKDFKMHRGPLFHLFKYPPIQQFHFKRAKNMQFLKSTFSISIKRSI